jgi:AcrR family transcriptional regulator
MRQLSPSTREAIVQGTLKLLSMREFGEVTTRAIARSAAVSEATVFRYFRRKEEILEAILIDRARKFFADIEEVLSLVDEPKEKLLALGRRHAQFAARNRDLFVVIHRESSFYQRDKSPTCSEGIRKFLARVQGILRKGTAQGVFRKDIDLEVAAMAFHSVAHTVVLKERMLAGAPFSEEVFVRQAEGFYQLYLRAVLADGRGR